MCVQYVHICLCMCKYMGDLCLYMCILMYITEWVEVLFGLVFGICLCGPYIYINQVLDFDNCACVL